MELVVDFFKLFKLIGLFAVLLIVAITVFVIVMSVGVFSNRKKQHKSPRLKVRARVVAKRVHYSKSRNFDSLDTFCYTTFELESGDRIELIVPYNEFGLLVEGDSGILEFQGNMYVDFLRE